MQVEMVQYKPVDKTGHGMQQQRQQQLHHSWLAPTPSEVHNERQQVADHDPVDLADTQICGAFRQDSVVHTAVVACLTASPHRTLTTTKLMKQVL